MQPSDSSTEPGTNVRQTSYYVGEQEGFQPALYVCVQFLGSVHTSRWSVLSGTIIETYVETKSCGKVKTDATTPERTVPYACSVF